LKYQDLDAIVEAAPLAAGGSIASALVALGPSELSDVAEAFAGMLADVDGELGKGA
jgi:hypothetical protein